MKNTSKTPAARAGQDSRTVLARILDTPNLERILPKLQPELLHRVIQSCGLEDCGELVMLATPEQLSQIFDLDLWRPAQPGTDEQFDAERFGIWLEVLAESGVSAAAHKLCKMDAGLVTAGLAQHARVFDCAAIASYRTTDGIEIAAMREPGGLACDVGGYRLIAKRSDSWEAIVDILIALDAEHPEYFDQVMRGCRALSNAGYEIDGLDDLLTQDQQAMFDVGLDREQRRDKQGYVTPAQARTFLGMARRVQPGSAAMPPENPIARAHLRPLEQPAPDQAAKEAASTSTEDTAAALVDVLLEAGIIAQPPRALLNGSQDETDDAGELRRIHGYMQLAFERDRAAYAKRNEELTYLANTLMTGCSLQGRSFTAQEAWDAAVAVCNLGLENWPTLWNPAGELVTVFQVGWTILHKEAAMYAAGELLGILADLRCIDRHIQTGLTLLRIELSKSCQTGMPWRARSALDVISLLDPPAWATLRGLIDEFPVLSALLSTLRNPRMLSVSASAFEFEFISANTHIAAIRAFMQSLPETLQG